MSRTQALKRIAIIVLLFWINMVWNHYKDEYYQTDNQTQIETLIHHGVKETPWWVTGLYVYDFFLGIAVFCGFAIWVSEKDSVA